MDPFKGSRRYLQGYRSGSKAGRKKFRAAGSNFSRHRHFFVWLQYQTLHRDLQRIRGFAGLWLPWSGFGAEKLVVAHHNASFSTLKPCIASSAPPRCGAFSLKGMPTPAHQADASKPNDTRKPRTNAQNHKRNPAAQHQTWQQSAARQAGITMHLACHGELSENSNSRVSTCTDPAKLKRSEVQGCRSRFKHVADPGDAV